RADIDEALFGHDTREHPALAPVAMMVARLLAVQPADHRLARDDFEAAARYHDRCREGASGHALATGAMASHRQQRCLANAEAYLAAAAAAFHRQGPFGHRFLPYQASRANGGRSPRDRPRAHRAAPATGFVERGTSLIVAARASGLTMGMTKLAA